MGTLRTYYWITVPMNNKEGNFSYSACYLPSPQLMLFHAVLPNAEANIILLF